jgi:hypothetical protein
MSVQREELLDVVEGIYRRGSVWGEPSRAEDGTVRVHDGGGVTWIAMAVLPEDVADDGFRERLAELSREHMPPPDGRRCVLELVPAEECADDVERILRELRLDEIVGVYSRAA